MRPIEQTGMINRAPDLAIIHNNEEQRANINQSNMQNQFNKQVEQNQETVIRKDDAMWNQNNSFDAKEKGKNEYFRQNSVKKKKDKEEGKVTVKAPVSFDIKI